MTTDPGVRRVNGRTGWRSLVRAVSWHRRLVAAACAAVAVAAGLQVLRPAPQQRVPVVVAAASLPGGRVLTSDDLALRRVTPDAAPKQAVDDLRALIGRRLAAPVGPGEPVTAIRVVGSSLLADYATELGPTAVITPLRVADAGPLVLLRPGDRVDVIAAPTGGQPGLGAELPTDGPAVVGGAGAPAAAAQVARVVVSRAPVLAVQPTAPAADGGPLDGAGPAADAAGGGLLVLATTSRSALDLAGAAAGAAMSVVVHPVD